MRRLLPALLPVLLAAEFADVNPAVFPPDDPRAKALPRMVAADAKRRMQEANLRESKAFAAVKTREQWEAFRDARLAALRKSLGTFPEPPKDLRIVATRKHAGDGYELHDLVYETRPGWWVSANLYLPAKPPEKMPGILISHSHHTSKTNGELQDTGMTWARAGTAVLVPDHLGHGERRQHDFRTEADYPKPFRVSRQDYFFRYNANLQLTAVGDSLMGWMVWDLMRGVDVLLKQPRIDSNRLILIGAVAGGGDPAGVTAALDPRIACAIPFNFGGWQPESRAQENPDRDFAWFGDGYWESTRGLRGGAAGGFAHYAIVGSVAPRKLIHAHEFAWNPKDDPAWPRLQTIFGFYGQPDDRLAFAHGTGTLKGQPPESSHCTHVGAVHRKMIYPTLKAWFDMPIPTEFSQRRPSDDLLCWTDGARKELMPRKLHEVLTDLAAERAAEARQRLDSPEKLRKEWAAVLGDVGEVPANPKLFEGETTDVPGGNLKRFALETADGVTIPFVLVRPTEVQGKPAVVVMVAQGGKAAVLKERADTIREFLKAGVAVCLPDVRGTGETRAGTSADRGSSRTSLSQTEQILGRTVLGSQSRDLRTVLEWLRGYADVDGKKLAVWGDSFAAANPPDRKLAAPLDAPDPPAVAEPGAGTLALLAGLFEDVAAIYAGGLVPDSAVLGSPYVYVPHEAVVPGMLTLGRPGLGNRQVPNAAEMLKRLSQPTR